MKRFRWSLAVFLVAVGVVTAQAEGARNAWYHDSIVNLHIDNHSGLVGKGYTVEELVAMLRDVDVDMIQVAAMGSNGRTTYPTEIQRHPDLGDWDTLAVWREVSQRLGRRFGIYINTRGLFLFREHPDWIQVNAEGRGRGKNDGLDICPRPSLDGSGPLEQVYLPMLAEFARYTPDALWVDGDHARTVTCYCPRCRAAWAARAGDEAPPVSAAEPGWAAWRRLEQERFDAYREAMAAAIHAAAPGCMYTSNHSWRFRSRDPRSAPAYADTLSGDISHGEALRLTRLSAMQIACEEDLPCDIMHNIMRINHGGSKPASFRRIAQQGAVTVAAGGSWFLWSPGSSIVQEAVRERARRCVAFARSRAEALGASRSANPVAVLLSETSWSRARLDGVEDAYDSEAAEHAALALQDAWHGVDMPNERILRERGDVYRVVVVAGQRLVSPETMQWLRGFVARGGVLVVSGWGLASVPGADAFLGVEREVPGEDLRRASLGGRSWSVRGVPAVTAREAEAVAACVDGGALLTRRTLGAGRVVYLALPATVYPDERGVWSAVLEAAGVGPGVSFTGVARQRHWVVSWRERDEDRVLHLSDMTSFVDGQRIVPSLRNDIDEESPAGAVEVAVPLASAPTSVSVVPETVSVSSRWSEGVLHLKLAGVDVHAAVILRGAVAGTVGLLPASTAAAPVHEYPVRSFLDFEDARTAGEVEMSMGQLRVDGATHIKPAVGVAAAGMRSLHFRDHPDARHPFFPYFVMRPRGLTDGVAYASFDLLLGERAVMDAEWREQENAKAFPVGPSVRFSAADGLTVEEEGEPLCALPVGRWFRVAWTVPLDGSGRYDLRLEVPGESPRWFRDLPCRSASFPRCGWFGLIGMGTEEAEFWVDNLRFGRVARVAEIPPLPPFAPRRASRSSEPVEPGLVGWWRFEEEEGSRDVVLDASGYGHHGDCRVGRRPGAVGQALALPGRREAVATVADAPELRFGTGDFSLAFFVLLEDTPMPKGYARILEKGDFPNQWWNVDWLSGGALQMEMGTGRDRSGTTDSPVKVDTGRWVHVAVVADRAAGEVRYFFDGRTVGERPLPSEFQGVLDVEGVPLALGAQVFPFAGGLDEVRIYRRALSATDVARLAAEGGAVREP